MYSHRIISNNICHITPPPASNYACVTYVKGESNFLIDCGENNHDVTEWIIPTLRSIGENPKSLNYVVFTHCHVENIGGLTKLKQLYPHITIITTKKQTDKIRNPSFYANKIFSKFPDDTQFYKESKGVFVETEVNNGAIIPPLQAIYAAGHDDDCVCWYHTDTKTLICGDSLQYNGMESDGIAFYQYFTEYRKTIKRIMSLDIECILNGRKFKSTEYVIHGKENCQNALKKCLDYSEQYDRIAKEMKKESKFDLKEITEKIVFTIGNCHTVPNKLGHAMITISEHIGKK